MAGPNERIPMIERWKNDGDGGFRLGSKEEWDKAVTEAREQLKREAEAKQKDRSAAARTPRQASR